MLFKKGAGFGFAVLLCFNFLAWLAVHELSKPALLEVNFFNVGQGDAIFIETSQGHQILVDGGPDSAILEKLNKEMPFGDRSIDLLVLTHPDSDHLAGLLEVLDRYNVKNILWTGVQKETNVFLKWLEKIKNEKANIVLAKKGLKVRAGGAVLHILYPLEMFEAGFCAQNCNDTSIVIELTFGRNKILLSGDISKKAETILLEQEASLGAQVLKVAHHGSKTSSSPEFLREVRPAVAVISFAADNRFGFPDTDVLAALENLAAQIFTTAQNGDIKITGNGERLKVLTEF